MLVYFLRISLRDQHRKMCLHSLERNGAAIIDKVRYAEINWRDSGSLLVMLE